MSGLVQVAEQAMQSFVTEQVKVTNQLTRFLESWADQANIIDPREPRIDANGEVWLPIGHGKDNSRLAYRTETDLDRVRETCRYFADENEFAINSHENRISYIVGWGHTYQVVAKDGEEVSEDELQSVRDIVEEFLRVNRWSPSYVTGSHQASGRQSWGYRQQENVFRKDRDGEVFIRKFRAEDGVLKIRYVEPEAVRTPSGFAGRSDVKFGIQTDPHDEETVLAYYVNGSKVEASEIQHRTRNGSSLHPRGKPIHWAVRKNLVRAQKILRNGSTVTEIQVAIAMIRKHIQGTAQTVQAFQGSITQLANPGSIGAASGGQQEKRQQVFPPGSVIDASPNTEYVFPAAGIDPAKYVVALQAELRAIASKLVMPEFMLTSDASNANFSSTMVAEGPAVKNFERLQWDEVAADVELIWDALRYAADSGRVDADLLDLVDVIAEPPPVQARNRVEDAQVAQVLEGLGWLSPQTGSAQFGLDYRQEQANKEQHNEQFGLPISMDRPELPPVPGEDDEGGSGAQHASNLRDPEIKTGNQEA